MTLTCLIGLAAPAVPAAAQNPEFTPPVEAEVTRGFQEPSHKYGPGHRGIDYEVPSGTPVRASGNGTVKFAGSVGGQGRFVTLQHAGDIETTYSYLSAIEVSEGEQVTQGQVIGQSGAGHPDGPPALHFGAKKSGEYIDPLMLLGQYKDITDLLELLELEQGAPASAAGGGARPSKGGAQVAASHFPEAPLGTMTPPPTLGVDGELKRRDELNQRIEQALAREPETLAEQKRAEEAEKQAQADQQAAEAADWWGSLPEAEQERLIKERPQDLGDRVGVPIVVRDRANRAALARRIKFLERRQKRMEKAWEEADDKRLVKALMETHRALPDLPIFGGFLEKGIGIDGLTSHEQELEGAKALARELDRLDERQAEDFPGSDVLLMDFDTAFADGDGTAVISIGNPEKAEHIGRVIPGLNNNLMNIAGTTEKAAEIQVAVSAERPMDWTADTSAVIAWLGYDTPNGISDGFFDDEARQGARELSQFNRNLKAARAKNGGDLSIHDYAHSFGSVVAGRAICMGMKIDDVVHLGSPGTPCTASEQLLYGAERVWAATALDDPIHLAALVTPLGPNPNWDVDSQRLPLDSRKKQSGHGEYFKARTVGIENIALLQTGEHESVN